jgi:thiol:disulfide interchange protein DsbA
MSKPIVDGKCPPAKAQGSAKQRSRLTRVDTKSSRRDLLQKAASLITAFPTLSVVGTNLFAPQVALAANAREGADYKVLQAQAPQESADRIDVLGFFWFGCPHCYTLEPALKAWVAKLPGDVAFRKVHVPWRDQLQQLYYSLEALNKLSLIDKVFEAVHKDKVSLQNAQQMADWISRHGVEAKAFQDAFDSFGVRTRMKRAAQLAEAYRLEGVPALGVAGKYLTAPSMAGSNQQALAVVDELLSIERRNRRSAKS